MPLDDLHHILVQRILRDDDREPAGRRDHVIDPTSRVRPQPHVADRRFAQWTQLELKAVERRPSSGPRTRCPISPRQPYVHVLIRMMYEPRPSCSCAVYWMANVIHEPPIPIFPGARNLERPLIITKKVTAELATCFLLKSDASRVFHHQQPERRSEGSFQCRVGSIELAGLLKSRLHLFSWRAVLSVGKVDGRRPDQRSQRERCYSLQCRHGFGLLHEGAISGSREQTDTCDSYDKGCDAYDTGTQTARRTLRKGTTSLARTWAEDPVTMQTRAGNAEGRFFLG